MSVELNANTLKIVATTEGLVTDPLSGKGYQQFQILSLLTDTLTAKNQSGEIVGLISDKWTIDNNGVTYKFHISKNAIFSDGSKVKAKDIEFTFNRLLTPGNKSEISIYLSNVVSKVYSDDEENVIFKLKGPYPFFLDLISMSGFGIVKEKEIGSVFSGPFVLSESDDKNKHWSLTRRENYKLYVVNNFKKIEIKIERDVERTIDLLNSNICHLSMGSPIEVALSSKLKKHVISAPLFNLVVTHVFTNQNNKFLTNYENRKLIKSILDKTKKMKGVLSRFDSELDTFFPKGIMNEEYYQNKLTTNKIKTKNDKKTNTKLKIVFPYGIFSKIAENLIVGEFEKNGFIVNQKSVKGKDLLDPIIKGDYDLLFIPYQGMIADPDGFLNLVSPDSLFKSASIPIKDLFEKLSSARFEDNKKYRLDKYAKAIESFESSLYLMPYSQNSIPIVYNNCLKIPDMNFSFHLDLRGISFDKN